MNRSGLTLLIVWMFGGGIVSAQEQWIYIASPDNPKAIYRTTLDIGTGAFGEMAIADDEVNTGFMDRHPGLPILYAATSDYSKGGPGKGGVKAYRIDVATGALTPFSEGGTKDSRTTHIEVSAQGDKVAVCHYSGDGTSLLLLDADGAIEGETQTIKHEGSSVHPKRQQEPHPHGVAFSRDGNFVLVADLGNDHVEVFAIGDDGALSNHSHWQAKPGAGPRHVTFHPTLDIVYCINELDSTISVLTFDPEAGTLSETQTIDTLPDDFEGNSSTAEVVVHPSGKFVYGSNRGHNSTAVFAADPATGHLSLVEHEPTGGDHPRWVGLDPKGRIYLAANMNDDEIRSFTVDQETGKLEPTGHVLSVGKPMCAVFVERE